MILLSKINRSKYLLLLFLPALIHIIIFKYIPMFGVVISFKDYNLFKGIWASSWVGLKYFKMFVNNPDFFVIMNNTFMLGVYKLVFVFPAPIILALLMNEFPLSWFKRSVQSVSYLPHFISTVVIVGMMLNFLSPSGGIINVMISWLGFKPVNFMIHSEFFRPLYALSEIWQHAGWEAIIYMAALSGINPHLYEASVMDGASRWKQMIYITLPSIVPVIVIMWILSIGHVLDVGFVKVYLLSNPSILNVADVIPTYVYRVGLLEGSYSYAAAIGLFTGIISLTLIFTSNWISRKTNETSLW